MSPPGRAWRFATPEDASALVALVRSAYRGPESRAGWTSEAPLVEGDRTDQPSLIRILESSRMLVVEEGGEMIACCRLWDEGGGVVGFGMFAVVPRLQGRGLGGWLVGEAERVAAEQHGGSVLELSALVQQTALVAWYERLGFVRTGETKPFRGHGRFARPLRDDLRLAVLRKPIGAGVRPAPPARRR